MQKAARGDESLEEEGRSGRPTVLTKPMRAKIVRLATASCSAAEIARRLAKGGGQMVNETTVRNFLKGLANPFHHAPVQRVQALTEVNKVKRADFCRDSPPTSRTSLVYMDEKEFNWRTGVNQKLKAKWGRKGEPATVVPVPSKATLFVAAAIGHDFKSSLEFYPPSHERGSSLPKSPTTFKSEHYISFMLKLKKQLLKRKMRRMPKIVRDRWKTHVSKASEAALSAASISVVEDYPPLSCDLDPIETVWAVMETRMAKHEPKTAEGYRRVLLREWRALPQEKVNAMVAGVSTRMQEVAEKGGDRLRPIKAFK